MIYLSFQAAVIVFVLNNAGIISYVIMETVENVAIRFDHVAQTFCEVIQEPNPTRRREMFSKAVQYHNAVLE